MAKDKTSSKKASKPANDGVLANVKAGRVSKAAEKTKAVAKDTAKSAVKNIEKKSKKKEPTPEPSSESESEDATSESSASSEDDSDASDEEVAPAKAAPKMNGNGVAKKAESESDSSSSASDSSDEDSDDDDDSDDGDDAKAGANDDDSDSESDSDEEEDDEPKTNGKAAVDDDDSEEDSDDSSDDDEEEAPKVVETSNKKRKAEDTIDQTPKKTKVTVNGEVKEASANLFVGNLSWNVDEDWLTREFEEFGTLAGVRIITDRDSGRSKGFGYVEFANVADAIKAVEAKNGSNLDGRDIRLDFSQPRPERGADGTPGQRSQDRASRFGDVPNAASATLFVGNISFDADESMLTEAFQEYGSVKAIRLPTDRETGAPKGFGYVEMYSIDEAKAAFESLQGADVGGRPIRLDYAAERSNDSPRGGGRGGRGGRGGFGDRGRGGRGGGGFGGRGGGRGGRGGSRGGSSFNRGGFGDFSGKKTTF